MDSDPIAAAPAAAPAEASAEAPAAAPGADPAADAQPARPHLASVAALTLLAVAEAAAALAVLGLVSSGLPWRFVVTSYAATNAWLAATFAPFGALVAAKRPRLAIGWLVLGFALCYGVSSACISLALWQSTTAEPAGWMSLVGWIGLWVWTPAVAFFFPVILALFPDGVLPAPRPRWRWLVVVAAIDGIVWPLSSAIVASNANTVPFVTDPPLTPSHPLARLADFGSRVGNDSLGVVAVVSLGLLAWRWYRSSGRPRAQLSWLLGGAVIAVVLFSPQEFNIASLWAVSLIVGVPLLPVAATVALLRHRLMDLDVVINRALVYVVLTAVLLAAYVALAELARSVLGGQIGVAASVPATAVVAVLFAPVRQRVQGKVDRMLYGSRRDPAAALGTVSSSLEQFSGQELTAALSSLAESLRLPGAAIAVDGRRTGRLPPDAGKPETIDLRFGGQTVGCLEVWPRRGQAALNGDDLATLHLLAGPLAAAVHALGVNEQLQESRRRLLTAREDEQRRLHHDLHDGLGPSLTAIALKADAARRDRERSELLMKQISAEARDAIAEVRRIAHDLRSPTLDSLGLLGALRRHANLLSDSGSGSGAGDAGTTRVTVDGPAVVPTLPPQVEEAAYLVAREAITNAIRHARATNIRVGIEVGDDQLRLVVEDDGPLIAGQWAEGFGVSGMRLRAERLGGELLHAGPSHRGGRVVVAFPIDAPDRSLRHRSVNGAA